MPSFCGVPRRRFDGCTRAGSPSCLAYCGGQGASPNPADSCCSASSRSGSSDPAASSMPSEGSPISDVPPRHGVDRERVRLGPGNLVPPERRRHARVGGRADRVRGGDGSVLRVLVVVEEDAVALLLPPPTGGEVRGAPFDLSRERERRPSDLGERPTAFEPRVDVDPPRARGLGPPDEAEGLEHLLRHHGDVADLRPLDPRHRVEVHPQLVGMIEIVRAHRVRVQVDAPEVHDPRELGRVADHDLLRGSAGWEAELDGLDPVGTRGRRPLLEEEVALGAVDEPLQRHRSSGDAAQRSVGDGEVVADEVELGVAGRREEDLVGVRDRHLTPGDLEDLLASCHGDTIGGRGRRARPGVADQVS